MGRFINAIRDKAVNVAEGTRVEVSLHTLQGLLAEVETLQLALGEEMRKNGTVPPQKPGKPKLVEGGPDA